MTQAPRQILLGNDVHLSVAKSPNFVSFSEQQQQQQRNYAAKIVPKLNRFASLERVQNDICTFNIFSYIIMSELAFELRELKP